MNQRSDPLVPILGTAVSLVVIASVFFVFYPRLRAHWADEDNPVVSNTQDPDGVVAVWLARADGVALVVSEHGDAGEAAVLSSGMRAGPHRFLMLTIYNFERETPFTYEVPSTGLSSPEGGAPAMAAATLLRPDAPAALAPILAALGPSPRVTVAPGHLGQILLVVPDNPAQRTAFVNGTQRFERRELTRRSLASWRSGPTLKEFEGWW